MEVGAPPSLLLHLSLLPIHCLICEFKEESIFKEDRHPFLFVFVNHELILIFDPAVKDQVHVVESFPEGFHL